MWPGGQLPVDGPGVPGRSPAGPVARFAGAREPVADNNDPKETRCAYDPGLTTLDTVEIDNAAGNFLGVAELRYSPKCQVAWGRFVPSSRMTYFRAAIVTIVASRPSTLTKGTPYRTRFDGQAVFGNILTTKAGCVEITVTIQAPTGGGAETTHCER
jgi:hypothetical protein